MPDDPLYFGDNLRIVFAGGLNGFLENSYFIRHDEAVAGGPARSGARLRKDRAGSRPRLMSDRRNWARVGSSATTMSMFSSLSRNSSGRLSMALATSCSNFRFPYYFFSSSSCARSNFMPSRAAMTLIPVCSVSSTAIFQGFACQTCRPKWLNMATLGFYLLDKARHIRYGKVVDGRPGLGEDHVDD